MPPQNKHNRLLWEEAQNIRRRHPERSLLRDHAVQWTLIQSLETSRTIFIAVFNDAGDIYIINSIHRKHKYHHINISARDISSSISRRLSNSTLVGTFSRKKSSG